MARIVEVVSFGNQLGPMPGPDAMIHVLLGSAETRARLRAALNAHDAKSAEDAAAAGDKPPRLYSDDEVNVFVMAGKRNAYAKGVGTTETAWKTALGVETLAEAVALMAKCR